MQETESRRRDTQRHSRPAIGINALNRTGGTETIVQSVATAQQHSACVLVAIAEDDAALRREIDSFDVTILEVADTTQAPRQQLIAAGKDRGLPGVILHPAPDSAAELDYEASYETFRTADQYVVSGHVTERGEADNVVIGINSADHQPEAHETLVREAKAHADEVVVLDNEPDTAGAGASQEGVTTVTADPDQAGLRPLLSRLARQHAESDAVVLLGPTTTAEDLPEIETMVTAVRDEDAEFVVGRAVTDQATEQPRVRRLTKRLRNAFSMGSPARATSELEAGPQVLSPAAARQLDRATTGTVSRADLIDAAIRSDIAVSMHEYSAERPATPSQAARQDAAETAAATTRAEHTAVPAAVEPYLVGPASDASPVLSVVIPTMNEEEGIGTCLEWVHDAIEELEVPTEIIISDSSTDRTPAIAREHGATVVEPDEPGYGYAYRYAFARARGEYIVMGDADTTYDFSEIPRLLNHLKETGADAVMGSRFDGTIEPGAMPPLHKYVGNPLLTRFLNVFYDTDVSDAHSGFRVFRADVLETLDLQSDGMEFASEMIMDASVQGLEIEEVPITYHERVGEETLDSFQDGWRHVRFMLVNAPGQLFSVPSAAMLGAGLLVLALSWAGVGVGGLSFSVHTSIAGSLLSITGFQVGMLGVFSAVAADPVRAPTDRATRWIVENVGLEHGILAGGAIAIAGGGYAATMVTQWLATGTVPLVVPNLIAFTAIVIGLQTVFYAFFLSVLATGT